MKFNFLKLPKHSDEYSFQRTSDQKLLRLMATRRHSEQTILDIFTLPIFFMIC